MKFELFDVASSGTALWTETQTGVVVSKGTFSVMLGAVTPLPKIFYKPLWVEVTAIAGPGMTSPIVFSPRAELASVPYALGPFVPHGSDYYLPSGNVGINGPPSESWFGLDVLSPSPAVRTKMTSPSFSTGFWADKYDASSNNYFVLRTNGIDHWTLGTIGNNDFSIYNWSPRYTYDLYITLDEGLVGIGTPTPTKKLDVAGSVNARDTVFAKSFMFNSPETSYVSGTSWASGRSLSIPDSFKYIGGLYNSKTSNGAYYEVDLQIPNGVQVLSIDVFGYDGDATTQLSYIFANRPNLAGGGNRLASSSSGISFSSGATTITATFSPPLIINNANNSYYIELFMPPTSLVRYLGYRVTFIQNGPGPITNTAPSPLSPVDNIAVPTEGNEFQGSTVRY